VATSLLWFRRDLRLGDHPALLAAAHDDGRSRDVLGVFVADDVLLKASGAPRRQFLAGCLDALSESINARLLIVHGRPEHVIPRLAGEVGADSVHVSADYGPYGRARDERVGKALQARSIELVATGSAYAVAPGRVRKPDGSPYAVFTPYFRGWSTHGWRRPAESGDRVNWLDPTSLDGKPYAVQRLSPTIRNGPSLPEPGEAAARTLWADFLGRAVADYDDQRNRPDHAGTSHLSPYLKWGCIHPRTLLADLAPLRITGATSYRRELAFREFYADQLFHHPDLPQVSADPAIDQLPWDEGNEADQRLAAWKSGRTGYPYIDAGMRQLLAEGWIHNRVRMAVASFLIKDLHLAWQLGAKHFMNHLVDGDLASNTLGWQWVAGAGAQAAPYYRVFNPIGQGEKFDPHGDYVRKYVPELAGVPGKAVHRPWELSNGVPQGYVEPIVDHPTERAEALRRFEQRPRPR
jgi:deoxyribodipyrimidine photo-lyase